MQAKTNKKEKMRDLRLNPRRNGLNKTLDIVKHVHTMCSVEKVGTIQHYDKKESMLLKRLINRRRHEVCHACCFNNMKAENMSVERIQYRGS